MSRQILNHIRDELIGMKIARNEEEFCVAWLGRGLGYMRTLRHINQAPSAEVLAILASKLEHYKERMFVAGDARADWATQFAVLHQQCRTALEQHARGIWQIEERMGYGA